MESASGVINHLIYFDWFGGRVGEIVMKERGTTYPLMCPRLVEFFPDIIYAGRTVPGAARPAILQNILIVTTLTAKAAHNTHHSAMHSIPALLPAR